MQKKDYSQIKDESKESNKRDFFSLKKIIIVSVILLVFVGVGILSIVLFGPDPMPVDWSKVQKIPNNVTLLSADDTRNPTDASALVKFNDDGTIDTSDWKVLQFTDLHFMQDDERNNVTLSLMIDTLRREKPDFVVLTGDIITRPRGRARAIQLADIFEKMGIYWCYCLGNHEGDSTPYTLSREENVRIWAKYDHCLLEDDVKTTSDGTPVWGLGNTVVNLLDADYKVVQSMIFMDSGSKLTQEGYDDVVETAKSIDCNSADFLQKSAFFNIAGDKKLREAYAEMIASWTAGTLTKEAYDEFVAKWIDQINWGSYDILKKSQMTWYEEQVKKVTNNLTNGVKTMLFIHIPLVEMGNVKLLKSSEKNPVDWYYAYPEKPLMVGDTLYGRTIVKNGWKLAGDTESYEKCYCSDYNNGMYDLMKSLRVGVNGLFCGHDHISNSVLYESEIEEDNPVYLCYGVCGGLQSYNMYSMGLSETDDYSLRGYAMITVHEDCSFDFYQIRYEDIEHPAARILNGVACH